MSKAASWLIEFAKRSGPDIAQWIWDHKKEALAIVGAMLSAYKWLLRTLDKSAATIAELDRHLAYLVESADNESEARTATEWRRDLDDLRRGFDLARRAPTAAQRRAERRRLEERLEDLRGVIRDAFIQERIEDQGGPVSRWAPPATP